MSTSDPQALAAELTEAVAAYERQRAAGAVECLVGVLGSGSGDFPLDDARRLLGLLRRKKWFGLMERLADGFILCGVDGATVRRQYAQALIDQGRLTAAEAVLTPLVPATVYDPKEHAEARGLLGRVYKQRYIDAASPALPRNRLSLERAVGAYYEVYREDPGRHVWHGINVAALLARGRRDGIHLAGFPEPAELAASILGTVAARHGTGAATMWDYAVAVEACVGLERPAEALEWAGRYLAEPDADAFEVGSTRRQLEEVWGITAHGEYGVLLAALGARMLHHKDGAELQLDARHLADERAAAVQAATEDASLANLERVLGTTGMQSLHWYRDGLTRSEAVVLISDESGRGVGTGFLIAGRDLSAALPPDEVFVLTNAHVVAENHVVEGTLYPDEAVVSFATLELPQKHSVELVWTSGPSDLDASLLRISPAAPDAAAPMPVAKRVPRLDGKQRVYVIGHPLGGVLSFSLQDNALLDIAEPKLHYRAPTEPGSSGSPVFNSGWKVVALHHAGGPDMPRLRPGEPPTYAANEGIWIQAIRQRIDEELPSPA